MHLAAQVSVLAEAGGDVVEGGCGIPDHDIRSIDEVLGRLGRLCGLHRQAAHLVGNNGETRPRLAGPSRFHGGVQRQ